MAELSRKLAHLSAPQQIIAQRQQRLGELEKLHAKTNQTALSNTATEQQAHYD